MTGMLGTGGGLAVNPWQRLPMFGLGSTRAGQRMINRGIENYVAPACKGRQHGR